MCTCIACNMHVVTNDTTYFVPIRALDDNRLTSLTSQMFTGLSNLLRL